MRKQLGLVFLTVSFTVFFCLLTSVQAVYQVPFITTDKFGDGKFTFRMNEGVFVTGGDFGEHDEVTIYLIPTGQDIKPENRVTEPVNAATIQLRSYTTLPTTLIWKAPLEPGEYDVWIDVNQNGQFDRWIDKYRISCGYALFMVIPEMVIPEFVVGPIGALATMLGAFMFYHRRIRAH